jgi:hypothetical protein
MVEFITPEQFDEGVRSNDDPQVIYYSVAEQPTDK